MYVGKEICCEIRGEPKASVLLFRSVVVVKCPLLIVVRRKGSKLSGRSTSSK